MVMKKVGITGASGMVGRSFLDALSKHDIHSIATCRSTGKRSTGNSSWVKLDLSQWHERNELDGLFPDIDAFIHLGALVPKNESENHAYRELINVNTRSCIYLADWASSRNIPLVFLSSSTVYADPERDDIKESDGKTSGGLGGFYGFSKLLAEQSLQYFIRNGLRLCILRPSSIYGFGLPENKMIPKFIIDASQDHTIELQPPVDDKINLIHSHDVAEAMLQALENEAWGVFNIASEDYTTILEIAQTCVRVIGKGRVIIRDDNPVRPPIKRFGLNCDLAKECFNFHTHCNLEDGIRIMWHQMQDSQTTTPHTSC